MLLWLNGLPGIGHSPQKTVLDTLMETFSKKPIEIGKFLDEDDFVIQLKHLNHKLIDFVFRERKQFCK